MTLRIFKVQRYDFWRAYLIKNVVFFDAAAIFFAFDGMHDADFGVKFTPS